MKTVLSPEPEFAFRGDAIVKFIIFHNFVYILLNLGLIGIRQAPDKVFGYFSWVFRSNSTFPPIIFVESVYYFLVFLFLVSELQVYSRLIGSGRNPFH